MNKISLSWQKIINLLTLTRPGGNVKNIAIILFVYYLSQQTATVIEMLNVFIPLSLICSSFYAYNSLSDNKIDSQTTNKNHYSNAVSSFDKKNIWLIIYLLLITGLIWGLLISPTFFVILTSLWLSVYFYSNPKTRYKEKKWLDIIFGAILTNLLRFLGIWVVLAPTLPIPVLGVLVVVSYKLSGYLLYKEFDRKNLINLDIKNTITLFNKKTIIIISTIFSLVTTFSLTILFLNNYYRTPLQGRLPVEILYYLALLIPLGIPFLLKIIGVIKNETFSYKRMRLPAICYVAFVLILMFLFV